MAQTRRLLGTPVYTEGVSLRNAYQRVAPELGGRAPNSLIRFPLILGFELESGIGQKSGDWTRGQGNISDGKSLLMFDMLAEIDPISESARLIGCSGGTHAQASRSQAGFLQYL